MDNQKPLAKKNVKQLPDLVSIRNRRGIPLERISRDTKISVTYLKAIEASEFKKLPGGIYDTSYIRQYARAIDYDEEDLLACYHSAMGTEPEPEFSAPAEIDEPRKAGMRFRLPALLRF